MLKKFRSGMIYFFKTLSWLFGYVIIIFIIAGIAILIFKDKILGTRKKEKANVKIKNPNKKIDADNAARLRDSINKLLNHKSKQHS